MYRVIVNWVDLVVVVSCYTARVIGHSYLSVHECMSYTRYFVNYRPLQTGIFTRNSQRSRLRSHCILRFKAEIRYFVLTISSYRTFGIGSFFSPLVIVPFKKSFLDSLSAGVELSLVTGEEDGCVWYIVRRWHIQLNRLSSPPRDEV